MTAQRLADDLARDGFSVVADFVSAPLVTALRAELLALDAAGDLRAAAIGRGTEVTIRSDVRADRIFWLEGTAASPAQARVMEQLEDLKTTLNRSLFLGLRETECHLALYPPGGHYDKHIDAFRGAAQRKVSFVLYLNDAWTPEDGGCLRLYRAGSESIVAQDVGPCGGTLACFLSEEIWHEVLPTSRNRLSLTGWFRVA